MLGMQCLHVLKEAQITDIYAICYTIKFMGGKIIHRKRLKIRAGTRYLKMIKGS